MKIFQCDMRYWLFPAFLAIAYFCTIVQGQVAPPTRLRYNVLSQDSIQISWKAPRGKFGGYKLLVTPASGGKTNQLNLQNTATKAIIQGLMPDQNYTVQIIAYNKDKESKPAQGQFRIKDLEKRKDPKPRVKIVDKGNGNKPSPPEEEVKFFCETPAIADIVILVDGSWSIGRFNFRLVRLFLENLVTAFNVGSEKTRIGLAQYSGDPRIEWHLNAFSTKDEVIEAVRNLPYKGGNTLTGLALNYIFENSFKPEAGARTGVSKIGILITDGKSQDDIIPPSRNLRESGVELFAIGVKNADENELREIASEPDSTHVYNVAEFDLMHTVVESLTRTVCSRVEEQDREIKGWSSVIRESEEQVEGTGSPGRSAFCSCQATKVNSESGRIMATNYSANQYEKAFSPKYLQNWSPAKPTKERISSHEGYTQFIANDRGHLLPSVPRSKASPWGSFMGTWQMPLKVPPARVTLTSRTVAGAASLTKWIQKNPDLLKASNGLRPEIFGKPHDPDSQRKLGKWITKTVQQAPSPIIIPNSPPVNLSSPDQPQSLHPSAGHTPGPQSPAISPKSPPGSPRMPEHWAGPNLAEVQTYKPGTPETPRDPTEKTCLETERRKQDPW